MGLYATTTGIETMAVGIQFTGLTTVASECITQAENEINKKLSRRYDIGSSYFQTTTSIPPMVRDMALRLGLGYFYEATARGGKESYTRADRYINGVMANLDDILAMKVDLVNSLGAALTTISTYMGMTSTSSGYSSTFDEDDPLDWAVNSTKLDDINSDRS